MLIISYKLAEKYNSKVKIEFSFFWWWLSFSFFLLKKLVSWKVIRREKA
jgi:hypothetical protein